MKKVFISYRRADSAEMSKKIYEALSARIGKIIADGSGWIVIVYTERMS